MLRSLTLAKGSWGRAVVAGIVLGLLFGVSYTAMAQRISPASSNIFVLAPVPATNDGAALGSATLQWSDLFLAEGGVINWDDSDLTLTQTGNALELAGGVWVLPDGTAGNPAMRFSSDAATGIGLYRSAANIWAFASTGGTSQLAWGAVGSGLGTAIAVSAQYHWSSTANAVGSADTGIERLSAGVVGVTNGGTGQGDIAPAGNITAGSGTGVTVNAVGVVRTLVYKVTVTSANCVAAATTCDLTIATMPAKTFLRRVIADLTTVYACTAVCTSTTLSGTLGTSAGGTQLLLSFDLDAATAQFGDADGELGASMNAAARSANGALFDGVLMSWSATTTLTYRITSGTGNLGDGATSNLSQGTIVFYLVTDVLP